MKTLLLFAPLFAFSTLANATSLDADQIQRDLNNADAVVSFSTLSNETLQPLNETITRWTQAKVFEIHSANTDIKAALEKNPEILIQSLGGELGSVGEFISGYPRLYPERKYRAFLKRLESNRFSIAGLDRGLFPLDSKRNFSRNRTDGSDGKGTGAFLSWDPNYLPIPYFISAPSFAGRGNFISAIELSFKTWRDPQDLTIEFLNMGCSSATRNENDGINNVIFVTQNWKFEPAAIAITRNFYVAGDSERAGQILDTDILLNGVNYQFTTSGESGKHDIQNIITHEVGHFLGLGHELTPQDTDATMYPDAAVGELKKRTLAATDLAGIRQIYSGVKEKLSANMPTCEISDGNSSCAAVHSNKFSIFPIFQALLYVVGILLAGRLVLTRLL